MKVLQLTNLQYKENPYEAAQKFIWRHQLPQIYLDQIADFITKNAQGVELGQTTGQYHDPFTGRCYLISLWPRHMFLRLINI